MWNLQCEDPAKMVCKKCMGAHHAYTPLSTPSGKSGVRQRKLDLIRIWSDVKSPMCVCTASRARSRFVGTLRTGRCDQFYSGTGKGLRCRWLAPSENRRAGGEGNAALGGRGWMRLFTTEYEIEVCRVIIWTKYYIDCMHQREDSYGILTASSRG